MPYSHLVEIFCWNETRRRCDACQKDTTIEEVKQELGTDLELRPFISEYAGWVSCHREACFTKIRKHYADTVALLLLTFGEKQKSSFKCRGGRYIEEKLSKADKLVFLKLSANYRYRKMEILKLSKNYRYRKMHQILADK